MNVIAFPSHAALLPLAHWRSLDLFGFRFR